ncbi:hypothetical protein CLOM_g22174 [Closterium sp. NIES-68]|nr:hypothetical protein CLOM_g22174 [Closterium sp. NIES-68]GJP58075.1 hypothetical protein CLOP_g20359 [Closterium sp. NIES-67]
MSKCDEGHLKKSSRHVVFQVADRVVTRIQEVTAEIGEIINRNCDQQGKGAERQQANQLKQLKRQWEGLIRQWNVRETLKYSWKVPENDAEGADGISGSKCGGPWESFDPQRFCQILDGKRVLIVGDSINMLLADAIRFNIRLGAKDQDSRVQWGEPTGYCHRFRNATREPPEHKCWTLDLCGDLGLSVRLFYIRDYYLNSTEALNDFMVNWKFDESWMGDIGAQNISVVVMNRGVHYIQDDQFQRQMWSTLLALRQTYPDLLIIVRNTPAGHPGCWLHKKPVKQPLHLPHTDWHWDGYAAQNEILKRLAEGVGGVYMDVNASAVWRADGHVGRWDCLHYCHPGPVDTWVQLLHNMLIGLLVGSS